MGRERKRSLLPALRAPSPGTLAFLNGWAGLLRVRELLCVIIMRHPFSMGGLFYYVYECSDH